MPNGIPTPASIRIDSLSPGTHDDLGTAVVIDVFRAFTTSAIALRNDAERIVMVDTLDEARALRDAGTCLFCMGERGGLKPDGFDFGNSPAEMGVCDFSGLSLAQATSNGTRGIFRARRATRVYAGALVTGKATAEVIRTRGDAPVAMGEKDTARTPEDELCALYLQARLAGRQPPAAPVRQEIQALSPRTDGIALAAGEVDACLEIDSIPFAVRVDIKDGRPVARVETPQRKTT